MSKTETKKNETQVARSFTGPELCNLEAHQVVELLRKGEVSPEDLLDASATRIEQVEAHVNALPTLCFDRAKEYLARWRKSSATAKDDPAWLGGLPITIKDLNAVAGVRTTYGTPGLSDFVPESSDPLVERLEDRGGLVVAKSNTPEMGAGGNTFNSVFGMTRNPRDTRRNAGGSSGGAAASLASGEVWLSHGSDLAGSLRTPAAYCGVVGLRPSPGRTGGAPADIAFNTEAVSGPMARSVMDCALFLDAMSGFDPRLPVSYPSPDQPFQTAVKQADSNVRIGFSINLNGFVPVSSSIEQVLRRALSQLESAGAKVSESCPQLPELDKTYRVLRAMVWAAGPGKLPIEVQQQYKLTLMENIDYGRDLSVDEVFEAQRNRSVIFHNMHDYLTKYDVLACPTVGLPAGPVEQEYPTEVDGKPLRDYIEWLRFSYLSTTSGLPSISIPVGFLEDGMPVGLQLIGPHRGEAKLLAVARFIEQVVCFPVAPIDPNVQH